MTDEPIIFRKQGLGLFPATERAREVLAKIKQGAEVSVDIKRKRNLQHHKKFFALANLVFENQEHYESVEILVAALKTATGHCDFVTGKDGTLIALPKSIAFHKMDQTEFEAFYDKCLTIIAEKFLPGVDKDDLRREVEAFL